MESLDIIRPLCQECFGVAPSGLLPLPQAGGDRRYYRLVFADGDREKVTDSTGKQLGVVAVIADNEKDAEAFVNLSRLFLSEGVPVAEVYACSADYSAYLVRDLGDVQLMSRLGDADADSLLRAAVRELVRMQTIDGWKWADKVAYPPFSRRQAMYDLNYFKYEFLKNSGVSFDEDALEDDFERLSSALTSIPESFMGFMMRDCQSRNIMVGDGSEDVWFIDYQGGRCGPCLYDVVSLLWQAKAGFSKEKRTEMLAYYALEFGRARGENAVRVLEPLGDVALFRTLQVLGAYGFRGLVQKRAHFIESIPAAILNLAELADGGTLDAYPELRRVARGLACSTRFRPASADGRLHIKVFSFSYKRGYPEDLTGNGGGFMFDCRGMHNPGRYDEYKRLTGLDAPVIEFLKERGEIDPFVERAAEMVAPTVDRYIRRGFSSLQIGFGCTGGRHRSVYCAEAAARIIAGRFPEAVVELCHREQGIERKFNS